MPSSSPTAESVTNTTREQQQQELTDTQVKQQLRSLKEPICLFGEDFPQRKLRLERILAAKNSPAAKKTTVQQQQQQPSKNQSKNILAAENDSDSDDSDSDSEELLRRRARQEKEAKEQQELKLLKPEHQQRLMDLRRRMNQTKNQNLQDVVQEHQLNQFLEQRRRRIDEQNAQRRKKGQEQILFTGDRLPHYKSKKRLREEAQSLEITAERSDKILDWNQQRLEYQMEHEQDVNVAAYNKRARNIPASLTEAYRLQKEARATASGSGSGSGGDVMVDVSSESASSSSVIPEKNKELLAKELNESRWKNSEYSRRRTFNEEDDVDYINEHNRLFNKKASRMYDAYTVEIKENLERGTAL